MDLNLREDRGVTNILITRKPLEASHSYRAATHSGMFAGIHRYDEFKRETELQTRNDRLVDLMEGHFRQVGRMSPPQAGQRTLIEHEGE